jgi:hypothetical protein
VPKSDHGIDAHGAGARAGKQQSNRARSLLQPQRQSQEAGDWEVGDQSGGDAFSPEGKGRSHSETSADRPQGVAKDYRHTVSRCRAERHADANLMCAPRDRVRE